MSPLISINKKKWRIFLVDLPRFLWAMRPGGLAGKPDPPWVYYQQWNERIVWEHERRGIQSSKASPGILEVSAAFPKLTSLMLKRCLRDWPILFQDDPPHTSDSVDVSFIIPHRGRERLPLLMTTLKSLAAQKHAVIECIVVEQSFQAEIKTDLPHWVRYIHTPVIYSNPPFNRSWALNVGARQAKGLVLVLHDGDTCVPDRYAKEVRTIHAQGYKAMQLTRFCFILDGPSSQALCKTLSVSGGCNASGMMVWNQGRTFAVDREAYFELGGHDESFIGWGGEDDEFAQRCRLIKRYPYCYLPIVHLYHPVKEDTDRHQRNNLKRLEALQKIPPELRAAILKMR